MKKKILSCMLAVAMVASLATATALTTSAEDTATRGTIYFDSTNLYGATSDGSKNMYCYTWSRTEGEMYGWDTKGCKMTNVGEHLYSYDVPSVNSAGVEVNAVLMVFHARGGLQTWEITFDDSCMGDTAYVYGDLYGMYPTNSTAGMPACEWKNNPTQGTHITINSSGEVLGWSLLTSETPESVVDKFIEDYKASMEQGKTGYDNPELVTDENRTALIAEINAIIDSRAVEDPTEVPTEEVTESATEETTDTPTEELTNAPTEIPTEAPTEKVTEAPTSTATTATNATSSTTATVKATATTSTNTSNGTVNTSQSSAVGTLALVFTSSLGVVFVANKKRENNN